MSEALLRSLRERGPISPAVQLRELLEYGRAQGWSFETTWRWAFSPGRIRWPHDTTHRKEWKAVLGETFDDQRKLPVQQREAWRSAFDRTEPSDREQSVGLLVAA